MTMTSTGLICPCDMAIPPFQQEDKKQAKPQQLIMLKRAINANEMLQQIKIKEESNQWVLLTAQF